jgi:hypothetical protein
MPRQLSENEVPHEFTYASGELRWRRRAWLKSAWAIE